MYTNLCLLFYQINVYTPVNPRGFRLSTQLNYENFVNNHTVICKKLVKNTVVSL